MGDRGQRWRTPPALAVPTRPAPPAPPPAPTVDRVDADIALLTQELLTALRNYRIAKRVFATRVEVLERKHGGPTAEADIAGKTDYLRAKAISDCAWWRGEVMA